MKNNNKLINLNFQKLNRGLILLSKHKKVYILNLYTISIFIILQYFFEDYIVYVLNLPLNITNIINFITIISFNLLIYFNLKNKNRIFYLITKIYRYNLKQVKIGVSILTLLIKAIYTSSGYLGLYYLMIYSYYLILLIFILIAFIFNLIN